MTAPQHTDTARLDWWSEQSGVVVKREYPGNPPIRWFVWRGADAIGVGPTARAAIDDAMEREEKG